MTDRSINQSIDLTNTTENCLLLSERQSNPVPILCYSCSDIFVASLCLFVGSGSDEGSDELDRYRFTRKVIFAVTLTLESRGRKGKSCDRIS